MPLTKQPLYGILYLNKEGVVMKDWNPNIYLKFSKERTQPAIDLVNKIELIKPKRILDIGCGPGNSTIILKQKWPEAEIIGIDSSEAMIKEAKEKNPEIEFKCMDATSELLTLGMFDLIFSNAALQWFPHQKQQIRTWFNQINKNGVLAFQVPNTATMPMYIQLKELIKKPNWINDFKTLSNTYKVHSVEYYYNSLCLETSSINIWKSEYVHIMKEVHEIIEWHTATGLRPYLDCLETKEKLATFLSDYEDNLEKVYNKEKDGRILFSFPRLFMIAKKE